MSAYLVKVAVCDDLQSDRKNIVSLIEKYVDTYGYLMSIDEYSSGEELIGADVGMYDLIFLDIFMKDLNGIQTAEKIMDKNPRAQIVFCSSSNEFAAESYDVAALMYLIKPANEAKLFKTLDRYFKIFTSMRRLVFMQNRMEESILLSDVLWIEADNHKSTIHTKNGDIVTTTQIKQFAEQLEGCNFVKPIRYALVALDAIKTMSTTSMELTDGTQLPVSRGMRDEIRKRFSDYKIKSLVERGEGR